MQKTKNIDVNQGASQFPGFEDYTVKGRTYHYMTETPLFQFGYGLSYTTFSIGTANISSTQIKNAESVKINIPVPHTGKRKGTEIVQVYVRKVNDTDGPTKTLRGFQRMEVAAGKQTRQSLRFHIMLLNFLIQQPAAWK